MTVRLDHANLLVRDVDGMIRFLTTAFPEFRIRGEGGTTRASRWVHVGTDDVYLALEQATVEPAEAWVPYVGRPGTNHLGFEVDDAKALRERLLAAGYRDTTYPNAHPYRTRVYFRDGEGNDWEFVEYHSDDPAKRHDYALPDRGAAARAGSARDLR
ncbi:MAG TPA: VOC family protein [Myxococcota bacterium]|jgi:catechol 2,3-dioxygenase-like lactoylglutathione lyase family enzyme|nr:VOC family protein [Myxococcota bacterium]